MPFPPPPDLPSFLEELFPFPRRAWRIASGPDAEVQAAPISDLVFDVPALIAYCSTFTELVPGDVIVTGTTGGVGAYRTPPLWMKDGDVVEVEVSGIGVLRNPVKDEAAAAATRAA